jgi:phosphoserine phosphatase RsbU/P
MNTGAGAGGGTGARSRPAALVVTNPSGSRSRAPLEALPFTIGRAAESNLVLRDNRASRRHAQVGWEGGHYFVEDLGSRNGITVNGERVDGRRELRHLDRIEFGVADSYVLTFTLEEHEIQRLMEQLPTSAGGPQGNLAKLRALVEVARVLQSALSTGDVLTAVVDAALAVTGAERGFLMLRNGDDLSIEVARDQKGTPLGAGDLRVPTRLINRALRQRRELLSMNFDPNQESGVRADLSAINLELRSVVCVPLVRVRTAAAGQAGKLDETSVMASLNETVGLLYLDSRRAQADLGGGNRELLQTLALEASTILENARLLEEERAKQKIEEELNIARVIQTSLLPRSLPSAGWFRAAGSSEACHQVGGDYFDVHPAGAGPGRAGDAWWAVVADVSGKGVSSALLASLLQGAFLKAPVEAGEIAALLGRINDFLFERTEGEKYATAFVARIGRDGRMLWANAGHPAPLLIHSSSDGRRTRLEATGLPLGMLGVGTYRVVETVLKPGDRVVAFSDGFSEAQNGAGMVFDFRRVITEHRAATAAGMHETLMDAFNQFSEGVEAADDVTLVVLEYAG